MDNNVARSGFKHVRICNDCDERISESGLCKCGPLHPFSKGARISICSDELGLHPVRITTIGRVGNGAFRAAGTGQWHDFQGRPLHGTGATGFARPWREGDEESIEEANVARARLARISTLDKAGKKHSSEAIRFRQQEAAKRQEAARSEREASSIDPEADGEIARSRAEAASRDRIAVLRRSAVSSLREADGLKAEAKKMDEAAAACLSSIEALRREDFITYVMEI